MEEGVKETNMTSAQLENGSYQNNEQRITTILENQAQVEQNMQLDAPVVKGLLKKNTKISAEHILKKSKQLRMGAKDHRRTAETYEKEDEMEADLQRLTEEERRQLEDQYVSVDFEMDEEMLENDDLLDEPEGEHAFVLETQEIGPMITKDCTKEGTKREVGSAVGMKSKPKQKEVQEREQSTKLQKDKPKSLSSIRRPGTQSPDTKGLAASKKLATEEEPPQKASRASTVEPVRQEVCA